MNNDLKDTQSVVDNYFNRLNENLEDYSSSFDKKEILETNEIEVITIDDETQNIVIESEDVIVHDMQEVNSLNEIEEFSFENSEYIDYTEQLTAINDNLTAINTTMTTINSLIVVLVVYCLYLAISNIFKLRAKNGGGK